MSKVSLSAELVVDAALAVIAADGLDQLTMRAVAARLGASPMSLYRHVADRDDLVARAVDATFAGLELPPHPKTAAARRRWLLAMAATVRARLLAHPGCADHLLMRGPTGPHTLAFMDSVCRVLADTGRSPREVAQAYDWLMTTGAVYIAKQERLERALGSRNAATEFQARTAAYLDRLPELRRVIGEFTGDSDAAFTRVVTQVVDALLAGR